MRFMSFGSFSTCTCLHVLFCGQCVFLRCCVVPCGNALPFLFLSSALRVAYGFSISSSVCVTFIFSPTQRIMARGAVLEKGGVTPMHTPNSTGKRRDLYEGDARAGEEWAWPPADEEG